MTAFYPNDIVVAPDGRNLRLLAVAPGGSTAWLIELGDKLALPQRLSYDWLLTDCSRLDPANKRPAAAKSQEPSGSLVTSGSATPAMLALRDRAWERIEPLVNDPGIFEPATRARLLERRAAELECSQNTLLLHVRRYWQGGQTLDALLGNYANSGRTDTGSQAGRGRRTKDGTPPYELGDEDKKALDHAIKGYYLKKEYHTLTAAYQWMVERHYTYADGNGELFIRPAAERPSMKQLSYWLRIHYPLEQQLRARKGDKDFERDHRHRMGSIQLDCHGAGHLFEIDATIADVYLVSSTDSTAIVGKPTLYLIIDRATRLIVGWYVGFENPCWSAAMQAILSIAEDKAAVCKRYGVAYDPADWPAHGVQPEQFLADQGEMASRNARRISPGLRAMVSNVPGLRPDWKPLVECGFKMTHQLISQDLPAYDPPSNQKRRRGKAYHRDATLNLEQFTSLIVKAIATHNRTMQTNFESSIAQVSAGVRPVPRELWTYEIRSRVGALARFDADTVRLELLPRESATVTDHGVEIRNCVYTFPEGEKQGWFVQARRKRFKVEVSLDYRRCDEIIVHDPNVRGRAYTAKLQPRCAQFIGMSFADVKRHTVAASKLTADAEQLKRQNLFDYHKHSQPIIKAADKKLKTEANGTRLSRSARRKDTANDRAVELATERAATAGMPALPAHSVPAPVALGPAASVVQLRQPPQADAVAPGSIEVDPNRPLSLKEKAALQRKKLLSNG
jgi:hypothetical protein